jgi:membrane protease YdiL (CAAX protease family)
MTVSKRTALGLSLAVISLDWLQRLLTQPAAPRLPAHFGELVVRVAIYKLVVIAVIYLLLRIGGEEFGALGVGRARWPARVGVGAAIGLVMFLGLNIGLSAALNALIPPSPDTVSSVMSFFRDPVHLLAWLPIGIFGGGVGEELERIFVLTRFERWLGRPGLVLGVVLSSAMFGFGHLYQGLGSALSTAVSGLVFALVYLRRRSALEPIVAHALSDVLAMIGATLGAH